MPFFYFMPFFQAGAAAGGGCMLGYEYRMSFHRSLLPVIEDLFWRKTLSYEINCMAGYGLFSLFLNIFPAFFIQMEGGSERGGSQLPFQGFIIAVHFKAS